MTQTNEMKSLTEGKKKSNTKCQKDEYSNTDGHGNTQLHRRLQGNSKANGTLT